MLEPEVVAFRGGGVLRNAAPVQLCGCSSGTEQSRKRQGLLFTEERYCTCGCYTPYFAANYAERWQEGMGNVSPATVWSMVLSNERPEVKPALDR